MLPTFHNIRKRSFGFKPGAQKTGIKSLVILKTCRERFLSSLITYQNRDWRLLGKIVDYSKDQFAHNDSNKIFEPCGCRDLKDLQVFLTHKNRKLTTSRIARDGVSPSAQLL